MTKLILVLGAVGCVDGVEGDVSSTEQAVTVASMPFVARQIDLPDNTHYYMSSPDYPSAQEILIAKRFVYTGQIAQNGVTPLGYWDNLNVTLNTYKDDPKAEQHVVYGKPIYAPADGVVIACWRNAPEGGALSYPGYPGFTHSGRRSHPTTIAAEGNHVVIRTDDDRLLTFENFKPGTVPSRICPHDAALMTNAQNMQATFVSEALVYGSARVRVAQGELIGRVGWSGETTSPLMHMSARPIVGGNTDVPLAGDLEPMHFHSIFAANASDYNPPSWMEIEDAQVEGARLVNASPFVRDDDYLGGRATQTALLTVGSNYLVSAARAQATGFLELHSYHYNGDPSVEEIEHDDAELAGAATQIAVARPATTGRNFVTAMRDGSGNLKLIAWELTSGGTIMRKGEDGAGAVTKVALARSPGGWGVVAAVRDGSGLLRVITFRIDAAGNLERVATWIGGAVSDVSIAPIDAPFSGAVVASRTAAGMLEVRTFMIDGNMAIAAKDVETSGAIGEVEVGVARAGQVDMIVTAMRDGDGAMRMISWSADAYGALARRTTLVVGEASNIHMADAGGDLLVGATEAGNFRLSQWRVSGNGAMERHGIAAAGPVTGLSIASPVGAYDVPETWHQPRFVFSSTLSSEADQKLIAWKYSN